MRLVPLVAFLLAAAVVPSRARAETREIARIDWEFHDAHTSYVEGESARQWAVWDDGSIEDALFHGFLDSRPVGEYVFTDWSPAGECLGAERVTVAPVTSQPPGERLRRLRDLGTKDALDVWVERVATPGSVSSSAADPRLLARVTWTFADGGRRTLEGDGAALWGRNYDDGSLVGTWQHGFRIHAAITVNLVEGGNTVAQTMTGAEVAARLPRVMINVCRARILIVARKAKPGKTP